MVRSGILLVVPDLHTNSKVLTTIFLVHLIVKVFDRRPTISIGFRGLSSLTFRGHEFLSLPVNWHGFCGLLKLKT